MKFRLTDRADERLALNFTPLIPCALLVIVFFMLTFRAARDDATQRRRLPGGELARPVAEASVRPVVLQLTGTDTVIVGGDEVPMSVAKLLLDRERSAIGERKTREEFAPSVVIRADANAPAGKVQELVLIAQQAGFERIILREKEEPPAAPRVTGRKGG